MAQHVQGLSSACLTMLPPGEQPAVRFLKSNKPHLDKICSQLADDLVREMTRVTGFSKHQGNTESNTTVLIVPRAVDVPITLLHDFHYESLVMDLLDGGSVLWDLGGSTDADLADRRPTVPCYSTSDTNKEYPPHSHLK